MWFFMARVSLRFHRHGEAGRQQSGAEVIEDAKDEEDIVLPQYETRESTGLPKYIGAGDATGATAVSTSTPEAL